MATLELTSKTGVFFIDDLMSIRSINLPFDQYNKLLHSSIIRASRWLNNNILNKKKYNGHFLKKKLRDGIIITEDMNKYLMNSYLHWKKIISKERSNNMSVNVEMNNYLSTLSEFLRLKIGLDDKFSPIENDKPTLYKLSKRNDFSDPFEQIKSIVNIKCDIENFKISMSDIDLKSLIITNNKNNYNRKIFARIKHNDHYDLLPLEYILFHLNKNI